MRINASANCNALMVLVNALMPNALMLLDLDEQRKNAANQNLIVNIGH